MQCIFKSQHDMHARGISEGLPQAKSGVPQGSCYLIQPDYQPHCLL